MVALAPLAGLNAPLDAKTFLRMAEEGAFGNARVELIDGKVIFKMAQSRLHILALYLVADTLRQFEGGERIVLNQATLLALPESAPDPDLMIVHYDPHTATRPIEAGDAAFVLEVSVTSLHQDRGDKARIYAEAGIPEYWIVNPVARQVEVRRDPFEGTYRILEVYGADERAAPLFAPETAIDLARFWPAPEPEA